jgi:hypothetical protein
MSDETTEFFDKAGTAVESRRFNDVCESAPYDECVEVNSNPAGSTEHAERRWAANDEKFWACSATYDNLPPGLYKPKHSNNIGYFVERQIVDTDDLLLLPDSDSEAVVSEIERFWELKPQFESRGFIHKRGILLWGDPGSGKTSTIQLVIKNIIESGGIALFIDHPQTSTSCLQMIRRIEPSRPIIAIMEDFESLVREYGDAEYLAMLDGESQVGYVAFVATTNYPEKLDKRFIDRPSRFDTIKKIPMPTPNAREHYFTHKEPSLTGDELKQWVEMSDGFSIAHLKEMIVSNRLYNIPIEKVVKRLNFMRKRNASSVDALPSDNTVEFGITKRR